MLSNSDGCLIWTKNSLLNLTLFCCCSQLLIACSFLVGSWTATWSIVDIHDGLVRKYSVLLLTDRWKLILCPTIFNSESKTRQIIRGSIIYRTPLTVIPSHRWLNWHTLDEANERLGILLITNEMLENNLNSIHCVDIGRLLLVRSRLMALKAAARKSRIRRRSQSDVTETA